MFLSEGGKPGDRRGFLHKSFIGRAVGKVAKTVIRSTPIGGAIDTGLGIARGFGRRAARPVAPRTTTARPSLAGAQGKELGRDLKFGGSEGFSFGGRPPPQQALFAFGGPRGSGTSPCRSGESARCCQLRNGDFRMQAQWQVECQGAGNGAGATGVGDAVMGRYGAALEPGVMTIERSVCLAGMQLGDDGFCYNKGAITNRQRMWPRGRRPLLTGGDMNAISIASRAGSKLERTTKRLRALGMMKALPKGRGAPRPHAHAKQISAVSVPS